MIPDEHHRCDERCVCPLDGKPLLWSPAFRMHACSDRSCKNAHGLRVYPGYREEDE